MAKNIYRRPCNECENFDELTQTYSMRCHMCSRIAVDLFEEKLKKVESVNNQKSTTKESELQ